MSAQQQPILTRRDGGVLTVTLNRPAALNALTPAMLDALVAVFEATVSDPPAVMIIEGAGRAFSAGVDLKVLSGTVPRAGRVGDAFDGPGAGIIRVLRGAGFPVIAKVHGACFTGALELVLHCDFIHTTADAKFGDTHAKFAIRPSWGMSQTLPRAVGFRRARELSFTARTFSGAEAAAWGLANAAHADRAALDAAVADIAARIAANDAATIAAYKALHNIAQASDLDAGLQAEVEAEFPDITDTLARIGTFIR